MNISVWRDELAQLRTHKNEFLEQMERLIPLFQFFRSTFHLLFWTYSTQNRATCGYALNISSASSHISGYGTKTAALATVNAPLKLRGKALLLQPLSGTL